MRDHWLAKISCNFLIEKRIWNYFSLATVTSFVFLHEAYWHFWDPSLLKLVASYSFGATAIAAYFDLWTHLRLLIWYSLVNPLVLTAAGESWKGLRGWGYHSPFHFLRRCRCWEGGAEWGEVRNSNWPESHPSSQFWACSTPRRTYFRPRELT